MTTNARVGAFYVDVMGLPTTRARVSTYYVDVLGRPTTNARVAAFYVDVLIRVPRGPAAPLQLRRRPDDNVTGSPILPRFHGTPQRSTALGGKW